MKKIKWHKFTLIALIIWAVNSIAEIKIGAFKPYAWALIAFTILVMTTSCSSSGWSCKKRYVQTPKEKLEKVTKPLA